ncbi:ATP-dependent helicase [Achlya hypogyna]|uniref:ATP-dependent helicase n=1 Tax=Achlya hypogyna TaxID=1202772 RepID=A0A1V9ZPB7_ACHHY|nr:ATP-dependent helicase [Achlya hypogyna]
MALDDEVDATCSELADEVLALSGVNAPANRTDLFNRVGTFFFKLKADGIGHWWCEARLPELSCFMLQLLDRRKPGNHIETWVRESYRQLGLCTDCINGYHAMLLALQGELASVYTEESMKHFLRVVVESDVDRLKQTWSTISFVKKQRASDLTMALYEVFMHPRLLRDFRFLKPMHKWISERPDEALELCDWTKLKQCPGLYMLLVCPDSVLRSWSAKVLSSTAHLPASTASVVIGVVEEWMYMLENDLYNVSMLELDLASTRELSSFMDVLHCTRTPTPQVLWAAFDGLFQTLEENMLDQVLQRYDNLPDLVFTYLQEATPTNPKTLPQVVLVVARSYGVLLRSLRFRLWQHTSYDAAQVWEMLSEQCQQPTWREFVTKAFVELCAPFLASLRPLDQEAGLNAAEVETYFDIRGKLLHFLLKQAPELYAEQATLRTTTTRVLCEVLQGAFDSTRATGSPRPVPGVVPAEEGALPETETLDIVRLPHRFWWPVIVHEPGLEVRNASCWTAEWTAVLLATLETSSLMALIDTAADTVALVLRKQLYLLRDTWMMQPALLPEVAWVSDLFTALCTWTNMDKIPLVVHAALFEAIGISAQLACSPVPEAMDGLGMLQDALCPYLERMTMETTDRGLFNVFKMPVVAQYMTLCLITTHTTLRPCIKRLIMHGGAEAGKSYANFTEPFQNLVNSHMESFVRGAATILMYMRVHGLQPVFIKEVLLHWTHTFESLPDKLYECIVEDGKKTKKKQAAVASTMQLARFPRLMHDFLLDALAKLTPADNEAYGVRLLRFARYVWRLWFVFHGGRHPCFEYAANELLLPILRLAHHPNIIIQRRVLDLGSYITQELASSSFIFDNALEAALQAELATWAGEAPAQSALQLSLSTLLATKKATREAAIVIDASDDDEEVDDPDDDAVPWFVRRARQITQPRKPKAEKKPAPKVKKPATTVGTTHFSRAEAAPRLLDSFYDDVDYEAVRLERLKKAAKAKVAGPPVKQEKDRTVSVLGYKPAFGGVSSATTSTTKASDAPGKSVTAKPALPDPVLKMVATIRQIRTMRKAVAPSSLFPFYRQILLASQAHPRAKAQRSEALEKPPVSFAGSSAYGMAFYPLLLEEVQSDIVEGFNGADRSPAICLRFETDATRENLRQVTLGYLKRPMKRAFRKNDVVRFTSTLNAEIACTGVYMPPEDDKKNLDDKVRVLFLTPTDKEMSAVLLDTLTAGSEWNARVIGNLTTSAREYLALMAIDFIPLHLRSVVLQPHLYKSTQSSVLGLISDLDSLRDAPSADADARLLRHLADLDALPMKLEDLRVTNIGVIVRKLRKYKGSAEVVAAAAALVTKWQKLLDTKDELATTPLFLPAPVWSQLRETYNSSQLQSVHSILNNYTTGVSLLQGPPGTGKTKTIMGIISGLLAIALPTPTLETAPRKAIKPALVDFSGTSSLGSVKASSIQQIKNASMGRQRLEGAMAGKATFRPRPKPTARTVSVLPQAQRGHQSNHILICAPSNGAVDELILRLRKDGLIGPDGKPVPVDTPRLFDVLGEPSKVVTLLRLGSASEDAPSSVKQTCLTDVVKAQVETHPKYKAFQMLTRRHTELKDAIKQFHTDTKAGATPTATKKDMTAWHRELSEITGKKRRLQEEVQMLERSTANTLLAKANIIACTLSKAGSGDLDDIPRGFDAVVIDEAAQAVETSTLIPLRERVARVIFVGDPKQLPATVKSVEAQDALFNRSMFERLADGGVPRAILRVQYRMHPFLREFPSKCFYNGILSDGPVIASRLHALGMQVYQHPCYQPFVLYDIEGCERDGPGGSKLNKAEALFGISMVEHMYKTIGLVARKEWSIGFVTPYKEQVLTLRHLVASKGWGDVEVNTVDGFQGREKDIIIMSCVRTKGVGFLKDIRRLNVALTRARYCCFVLGHAKTLCKDPTWKQLVSSAFDRQMYIKATQKPFEQIWAETEVNDALKKTYMKMHAPLLTKSKDEAAKQSKRKRAESPDGRDPVKKREEASENTLPTQPTVGTDAVVGV